MKIVKATELNEQDLDLIIDELPDLTNENIVYIIEPGVGYLSGSLLYNELEIYQVYVDPAHRRQGWGSRILETALQQHEIHRAILEVRQINEPARRLYEQHHFTQIAMRENYYNNPREDAVIMEWRRENDGIINISD